MANPSSHQVDISPAAPVRLVHWPVSGAQLHSCSMQIFMWEKRKMIDMPMDDATDDSGSVTQLLHLDRMSKKRMVALCGQQRNQPVCHQSKPRLGIWHHQESSGQARHSQVVSLACYQEAHKGVTSTFCQELQRACEAQNAELEDWQHCMSHDFNTFYTTCRQAHARYCRYCDLAQRMVLQCCKLVLDDDA